MFLGGGDYFGDAMGHAMSDDDGDGIYTVTVVPDGYRSTSTSTHGRRRRLGSSREPAGDG